MTNLGLAVTFADFEAAISCLCLCTQITKASQLTVKGRNFCDNKSRGFLYRLCSRQRLKQGLHLVLKLQTLPSSDCFKVYLKIQFPAL
jgi:hypothetical protein